MNEINEDYKRKHYNKNEKERDIGLNDLLDKLNNKPYSMFEKNEFNVYDKIRIAGNKAAHHGTIKNSVPFVYTESELTYIMDSFNQAMHYLNKHAEKQTRLK